MMSAMTRKFPALLACATIGMSMLASSALAQTVPGPADAGRIRPEERIMQPDRNQDQQVTVPSAVPVTPAPEGAKDIHFTLKAVQVVGATALTREQLDDIYAPYIGKEVTLDIAWMIAGTITERYHNKGYFLSRAYVPQQRIKDGGIIIQVVEGYIGEVELPDKVKERRVVRGYIDRLVAQKPVKVETVESFLLRLNDLPGYSFRAVLSALDEKGGAAVKLTLIPSKKDGRGQITFDNYSSRYLGPNEVSLSYSTSLLPLQQTSATALTSLPFTKLRYGMLDHTLAIAPDITLEFNGGVTQAFPGYTLERYDIDSVATSASLSLNYQWLRQRQENLALKFTLDSRNVTSDILNTPLTRDHIRALRAGASYDLSDSWRGYNMANLTLSQGIDGLGASQKGDLNLSRSGARPDFTKAELSLSRLQGLTQDWSLYGAAFGQLASGVLYSSEQFGYGGQAFGRAFDASEITGDHGVSGALELRYGGWSDWQPVTLQPYGFYDIGTVWNSAPGQPKRESGASAGLGLRFETIWHQSGNIGLAWPLTRSVATPIYGQGSNDPRILLQIGQNF